MGGAKKVDRNFVRYLPRQVHNNPHHPNNNPKHPLHHAVREPDPPLLLCTKSDFTGGISSHFLHVVEPLTETWQVLAWGPNEGLISGLGVCDDKVYVIVTEGAENLLFEYTVRKEIMQGVFEDPDKEKEYQGRRLEWKHQVKYRSIYLFYFFIHFYVFNYISFFFFQI